MKVEHLTWDSDFFGKRVWRIEVGYDDHPADLREQVLRIGFDVMYVMCPEMLESSFREVLASLCGNCVDCRVIYRKKVIFRERPADVVVVPSITPEIYQLAYMSGAFSRFKTDPQFLPDFHRLYDQWIRNAFKSEIGIVFGFLDEYHKYRGMVTTDEGSEAVGKIGLIAVEESFRGKGIGAKLLQACDHYYSMRRLANAEVVTQANNVLACKLYEKNGYSEWERTRVWHIWKGTQ